MNSKTSFTGSLTAAEGQAVGGVKPTLSQGGSAGSSSSVVLDKGYQKALGVQRAGSLDNIPIKSQDLTDEQEKAAQPKRAEQAVAMLIETDKTPAGKGTVAKYIRGMSAMVSKMDSNAGKHVWLLTEGASEIVAVSVVEPTSISRTIRWAQNSNLQGDYKNATSEPVNCKSGTMFKTQEVQGIYGKDWFNSVAAYQMAELFSDQTKFGQHYILRLEWQLERVAAELNSAKPAPNSSPFTEVNGLEDLVLISCIEKIRTRLDRSITTDVDSSFKWLDLFIKGEDLDIKQTLSTSRSWVGDLAGAFPFKPNDFDKDEKETPLSDDDKKLYPLLNDASERFLLPILNPKVGTTGPFQTDEKGLLKTYGKASKDGPAPYTFYQAVCRLLKDFCYRLDHIRLLLDPNPRGVKAADKPVTKGKISPTKKELVNFWRPIRVQLFNMYYKGDQQPLSTKSYADANSAPTEEKKQAITAGILRTKDFVTRPLDLGKPLTKEDENILKFRKTALKNCLLQFKYTMNILDKLANYSTTFFKLVHGKSFQGRISSYALGNENSTSSDPDSPNAETLFGSPDAVRLWLQLTTQWLHIFQALRGSRENTALAAPVRNFFKIPSLFERCIPPEVDGTRVDIERCARAAGFNVGNVDHMEMIKKKLGTADGPPSKKAGGQDGGDQWAKPGKAKTHCECTLSMQNTANRVGQVQIGVSKKCCFLCNLWIDAFNKYLSPKGYTKAQVHSYHGKVYQWSPPAWTTQDPEIARAAESASREVLLNLSTAFREAAWKPQKTVVLLPDTGTSGDELVKPDLDGSEYSRELTTL